MSQILNTLAQGVEYVHSSAAPVNLDGGQPAKALFAKEVDDLDQIVRRGLAFNVADLPTYIDAVRAALGVSSGIDDRKLLLEKILVLMSRLPDDSKFAQGLEVILIDILYKDLPHPPSGYLVLPSSTNSTSLTATSISGAKYAYRSADGSNYNPLFPTLGKAGSPYARSVPSKTLTMPPSALPDAGLVFDTLLRRPKDKSGKKEDFFPHPGGISSLFFAFADLVIHSIFNTNQVDWTVNNASSYLDLSPLYGSSQTQVDEVRRMDGTGRLFEDVFADVRLKLMPPAVCALLVLLCRNHNYVADKIRHINERGNFKSPPPTDEAKKMAQDDELFSRARLVNSGFFMKIILGDYVGAILGLTRDGSSWRLDPLAESREIDHEVSPRGQGNVCAAEFNLLYRWHAAVSKEDTEWTENEFNRIFEGKDFSTLTISDFKNAAHKYLIPDSNVTAWTFSDLKRGADGRFNDADLAKIIQNATEASAGAFRARGTPEVLRVIEVLGIEQARQWGLCSLNEFRQFIGLKPYSTFKEWNPDKDIYMAAEALYGDIDNLELHVGMQAEEAKVPGPGAGFCPGYTISRTILADAVCLTRGDRFLTVEFTPFNLTSWGYQDCQYEPNDGSYGGMLTKLLFRTLPEYYPTGSAYVHFPFMVPDRMKEYMSKQTDSPVNKYTWTRPVPPQGIQVVDTYEAVSQVLSQKSKFMSESDNRIYILTKGVDLDRELVVKVLSADDVIERWAKFFKETTQQLIKEKSVERVGTNAKYVDIVKDVINLVPLHWISRQIIGLPLKTNATPGGVFREQEVYDMLACVCQYVFVNFDPADDWLLREKALKAANLMIGAAQGHLGELTSGSAFKHLMDSVQGLIVADEKESHAFLAQLLSSATNIDVVELASSLFSEVVPTAAHYSQAIAHIVDFYLGEGRELEREDIVQSVKSKTAEGDAKVLAYIQEALRLNPILSGVYRTAVVDADLGHSVKIQSGEKVFASIGKANLDAGLYGTKAATPDFSSSPNRPPMLGIGEYGLLSSKFFQATATQVLGVILGLNNVTRAPGTSGQFNKFEEELHGTPQRLYIGLKGQITPFPASLLLQYVS